MRQGRFTGTGLLISYYSKVLKAWPEIRLRHKNEDCPEMNTGKALRAFAALFIILLIGYFYSLEVARNWTSLQNFKLDVNVPYLFIALSLYLLSYLLETYIWQVCINRHLGRHEINFSRSIAVVNASGLLKYLPGRIWTYAAQLVWLKKYGISKPLILYVNAICILASITVSLYLGLIYLSLYTNLINTGVTVLLAAALMLSNAGYVAWNSLWMNKLTALAGRILKKEIQPLNESKSLILLIQFVYMCSWTLMGAGGYFLAAGIGLTILPAQVFALLAAMSLSWLAGYLAVISPGGLGVREGLMLLMLSGVTGAETALIFPILSRLMYMLAEALLGVAALLFGIKYKVFSTGEIIAKRNSDIVDRR
jgi:uncharacterized membrane protein YbhN (UPF0104 family)